MTRSLTRTCAGLYAGIANAAHDPQSGRLRQQRSSPFLMVPVRPHFIIFDTWSSGVVVLTIRHQVRNIEILVGSLTPTFLAEIERLKRR